MSAGVAALQAQQLSNSAGNGWSQCVFTPISCCDIAKGKERKSTYIAPF